MLDVFYLPKKVVIFYPVCIIPSKYTIHPVSPKSKLWHMNDMRLSDNRFNKGPLETLIPSVVRDSASLNEILALQT